MTRNKTKNVVLATLETFCKQTSISGISNASQEKISLTRRTIWSLVFLAGVGATTWSLYTVIVTVLVSPTTTSTFLVYESKVRYRYIRERGFRNQIP